MLNQLCLSTMFVCSVSTVMFNANPLLRYDGYYILSDLTEIPNLRQKATSILNRKLADWCLGLEEPDDPFLPQRNQVFFRPLFDRRRHLSLGGAVLDPVVPVQAVRTVRTEDRQPVLGRGLDRRPGRAAAVEVGQVLLHSREARSSETPHVSATLAVLAGLLAVRSAMPLPHRVYCLLEVKPARRRNGLRRRAPAGSSR